MALPWSKTFTSADDGSVLTGSQLGTIQTDIDTSAVLITGTQTITGDKTFSGTIAFTGVINTVISLLSSTASVNLQTVAKTNLYTVPTGKTLVVTNVVIRVPSGAVGAGATSHGFGVGATATGWRAAIDLANMTSTQTYVLSPTGFTTNFVAADVFGMYVTTGTTNNVTATIDVFGYLF